MISYAVWLPYRFPLSLRMGEELLAARGIELTDETPGAGLRSTPKCRGFEMVGALVVSGCSVSIVPGLRLLRPPAGVAWVKLRPEVGRKIQVTYRRGERNRPAIKVFVEEIV